MVQCGESLHEHLVAPGEMLVAEDLMTLTIGEEITVGRADGGGSDIFTESNVVEE